MTNDPVVATAIHALVCATSVGKAMTDEQRAELMSVLISADDVRNIPGWYGDQIRKAAQVAKGDFPGHPFRGNQWTTAEGATQGGTQGSAGGKDGGGKSKKDVEDEIVGIIQRGIRGEISQGAMNQGRRLARNYGIDYEAMVERANTPKEGDQSFTPAEQVGFKADVKAAKAAVPKFDRHINDLGLALEAATSRLRTMQENGKLSVQEYERAVRQSERAYQLMAESLTYLKDFGKQAGKGGNASNIVTAIQMSSRLTDAGELAKGLAREARSIVESLEARAGLQPKTPKERARQNSARTKGETVLQDAGDKAFGVTDEKRRDAAWSAWDRDAEDN